jgi:hypothetical protein
MSTLNLPEPNTSLVDERSPMGFERDDGWRRALTQGFVVLVVFVFVGLWLWQSDRTRRGVTQLPDAERKILFERTMQTLGSVCKDQRDEDLDAFCDEQAKAALAFPECDDACRSLARAELARPTR